MKTAINIFTFVLLYCAFFTQVNAQQKDTIYNQKSSRDTTTQVVITLKDQSTIKGVIMAMNLDEISLKTDFAGTITIKQNNIISIVNSKFAESQKQQNPRIYNPNNPNNLDIVSFSGNSRNYNNLPFSVYSNNYRYNFSNNYEGLKKNELVFSNIWVLYNCLDYGINNNFSMGGGVLFLGFGGFINVLARGQIHLNENIKIGASYNYFMILNSNSYSNQESNFGLFTGGITLTGKKGNITISLANGNYNKYGSGQSTNENVPGFSVSGSLNISDKTSLVSDNFYASTKINPRSYSIGLRVKSRNGNFDFGLMSYSYEDSYYNYYSSYSNTTQTRTIPIPFLAYSHKIN